jgi:hypothetical protein
VQFWQFAQLLDKMRSDPVNCRHVTPTTRLAVSMVIAFAPAAALVGGLPFVNRLEPFVLGLPFLLFWFAAWVAITPVFLAAAYVVHRSGPQRPGGAAL